MELTVSYDDPIFTTCRKWHRVTKTSALAGEVDRLFTLRNEAQAWAGFLNQGTIEILEEARAEFSIYGAKEGKLSFPKDTTEPQAWDILKQIACLPFDVLEFKREWLKDSKAKVTLPLSLFTRLGENISPTLTVYIHKHWPVRMENFSVGQETKDYKKYKTLEFRHPYLRRYSPQEPVETVTKALWVKGHTREEWLQMLIEQAEREGKENGHDFSIFEREAIRALNGQENQLNFHEH